MRSRLGFRGRVALGAIVHTALLAAVLALLSFSNAAQDPVFLAAALGGTLALSITLALLGAHLATRPLRALTARRLRALRRRSRGPRPDHRRPIWASWARR
jgi:hypothetical protein